MKILARLHDNAGTLIRRLYPVCTLAASEGNLEILKWARSGGYGWNADTCAAAIDVVEWIQEYKANTKITEAKITVKKKRKQRRY